VINIKEKQKQLINKIHIFIKTGMNTLYHTSCRKIFRLSLALNMSILTLYLYIFGLAHIYYI